jgi:allophanate hydrolase subunit 2
MGETVVFPYPKTGARSYLAGVDGFIVRGQTQSRNLRAGAEVNSSNQAVSDRTLEAIPPTSSQVRIVRGSHAGLFDFDRFLDMGYTIDIDSNRMGTRLNAPFPVVHSHELRSEPSDVGVIQMPGSGNPIILGPDGPTIGGYPRIAYVIRADLPLVAQLAPSQAVKFREVDLDEAMFLDQNASDSFRRTLALIKAQAAP